MRDKKKKKYLIFFNLQKKKNLVIAEGKKYLKGEYELLFGGDIEADLTKKDEVFSQEAEVPNDPLENVLSELSEEESEHTVRNNVVERKRRQSGSVSSSRHSFGGGQRAPSQHGSDSDTQLTEFRSKLKHLLYQVLFLEVWSKYLSWKSGAAPESGPIRTDQSERLLDEEDPWDEDLAKLANGKLKQVEDRFVKLGAGYEYLTSSRRNLLRFLNCIKLRSYIMIDERDLLECQKSIQLYYDLFLAESTEQGAPRICYEEVDPNLLVFWKQDFLALFLHSRVLQGKPLQTERAIAKYEDLLARKNHVHCVFRMKRHLRLKQLSLDLYLLTDNDRAYTVAYRQFKTQLLVITNTGDLMKTFMLDLLEESLYFLQLDTRPQDLLELFLRAYKDLALDTSNVLLSFLIALFQSMTPNGNQYLEPLQKLVNIFRNRK